MTDELKIRCLIVDDEQAIRALCRRIAESAGFKCAEAETAESAMSFLEAEAPSLVLSDLKLPDMSGVDLLRQIKIALPRTEVAIMTGHGTIDSAVQAMRLGAYDYVQKPFRVEELKLILQRMEEKVRLVMENEYLRDRVKNEEELSEITGSSARIQDVLRMISRLKDTRTPVLITGESGTGKELVARAIHFRGSLAKRPFIAVDCGALVPTLAESELFGHERGAFTGAIRAKQGLFRAAAGGTIFLDEVGELSLELQAKLLRTLQEKEVRPVGSNQTTKVDVRVIAATNRDLEAAYQAGTFRKDLFFRLNVVTIHMPPLRERRNDIPALVHSLATRYCGGDQRVQVTPAAMYCLKEYQWPGNVRELENCIERALALATHKQMIDLPDLPAGIRALSGSQPAAAVMEAAAPQQMATTDLEDIERATIQQVFEQVKGDKTLAGKMLGISRATLYRKLKRYGIGGTEAVEVGQERMF
jgi:two-component system, NtrC family, response regulator AtoC